jgi:hypothetical protein
VTTTTVTPEGRTKRTTEETRVTPTGETSRTRVTVSGEVVGYVPGRTIVLRQADGNDMSFNLGPNVVVPAEIQTGRRVTLQMEPGPDGSTLVKRVTTTSITPEGQTKRTVEETRTAPSGATSRTQVTTVSGEVVRYVPGRTLVLRQAEGNDVSFALDPRVVVPAEVQMGRQVTVYAEPGPDGSNMVTRVTTTSMTPEGQMKRTVEETRTTPSGETSKSQTTTISGEVVSYVPGRTLVLHQAEGNDLSLALAPSAVVPAEVQTGRRVTVDTEPGPDGTHMVTRVTTTSITPEGQMKRTVEETNTSRLGGTTKTTLVTIQGRVEAYAPGKTITILRSDGSRVTYVIGQGARLPADIPLGKTITIQTVPVVETIILDKN